MYSYEGRIRAVRLYIKFGKRTAATICQLGYPTGVAADWPKYPVALTHGHGRRPVAADSYSAASHLKGRLC